MSDPPRLALGERGLGAILGDSLRLYFRHFLTFVAVGLAVVLPVELIVSGIGLGRFGAGVEEAKPEESAITLIAHWLVTTPLVAAMTVYMVLALGEGTVPGARRVIQAGLDFFRPVFWPVAIAIGAVVTIAAACVALTVEVDQSFGLLILVPVYLVVRWYFVPHAVVAGKARGLGALRASWALTRGWVLRAAGILLLGGLLLGIAGQVAAVPVLAIAQGTESGVALVLYSALAQGLAAPALALVSVLLYFDLRARGGAAAR